MAADGATAPPVTLGAVDLRDRLASGALRAQELVEICLARIEAREPEIGAWAWLDGDHALEQARKLDAHRASGRPIGPLHGMPVAVKDIIDTAKIPTENGIALDKGRVPNQDAFCVEKLKQAGAIILGKTVSTPLAHLDPAKTRNPRNPGHTPGGSSSGSAAAVADGMVPLAIGSQTGGSVIRPAAYCGVTGFKPSFGAISRRGVLAQSPSLDTIGVFASDPEGAALLADLLSGHDPADPATSLAPFPRLLEITQTRSPMPPVFAFVRPPGWDQAEPELHEALAELIDALGEQVFEVPLPEQFGQAADLRGVVNNAEMARCCHRYWRDGREMLGPRATAAIEEGRQILAHDYLAALDWRDVLYAGLAEVFERCDAILCPSALGPAPKGLGSIGDSIFNGLWTFCGTPAVNVPILTSSDGLPIGVQLVGPRDGDGRLLRTAKWLADWAEAETGSAGRDGA